MTYKLLSEHNRTARKDHNCIWCNEKILKGQTYIAEHSVYDGFQNHHWHPECRQAAVKWFYESREDEFDPHIFKRGTSEER